MLPAISRDRLCRHPVRICNGFFLRGDLMSVSIFNHVLGPIMHGPSSSHTAASFHIGRVCRYILGEKPRSVICAFDKDGSYGQTFRQQGSDKAFAVGMMGLEITDDLFYTALEEGEERGIHISFPVEDLTVKDHPNVADVRMTGESGKKVTVCARSIGGGAVQFTHVNGFKTDFSGDTYEILVFSDESLGGEIPSPEKMEWKEEVSSNEGFFNQLTLLFKPSCELLDSIAELENVKAVLVAEPVFFPKTGETLFESAQDMLSWCRDHGKSLGEAAMEYEARLLGLTLEDVEEEMLRRYRVMEKAVEAGLAEKIPSMKLLYPSARNVMEAEKNNRVAIGGIHTRAAARAMAVMHINGAKGLVCAAPTAGSAGTVPGVFVTLKQEMGLCGGELAKALFAASAVGLVVAKRATFAAEVAGCQVEIGVAGAMGAAGVAEFAGAGPEEALNAAAISLQNTMGSVCDLVQGFVEIPCHTRNAAAAANAFLCADLVMGGYENPVPLDETIDAMYSVGKMMPPELRCTAKGGLAICPSALTIPVQE